MCVLVTQSCPTLCDPMDCSPPGSSVHGILQAGMLEWVAVSFSRRGGGGKAKKLSCISYYLINRRIRLSFEFMIFYSLYTIGLDSVNF